MSTLPPLEVETAHFGGWLSMKSLSDLIGPMALNYSRRLRRWHNGTREDLAQAAHLALLEWERANGTVERVRELVGIGILHRAMVAEVRQNRRESAGELKWVTERPQLSDKQVEMLALWTNNAAKAARRPAWECLWLKKACGWNEFQISDWFKRKTDDRHYYSPDQINRFVRLAQRRIKLKMMPDLNVDLRLLAFYT